MNGVTGGVRADGVTDRMTYWGSRGVRLVLAGAFAGMAGACSSLPGVGETAPFAGNIFTYRAPTVAANPAALRELDVDCPIVQVAEGQSVFRAFTGSDRSAEGVRYQYSFGELSRECKASEGAPLAIRVGVSGYVIAGPSGASGAFTVPIRVKVVRDSDKFVVASQNIRVAASLQGGEAQSPFTAVTEPLQVPYTRREADEDYSIYVGFEGGSAEKPKAAAPRRRRR